MQLGGGGFIVKWFVLKSVSTYPGLAYIKYIQSLYSWSMSSEYFLHICHNNFIFKKFAHCYWDALWKALADFEKTVFKN